MQRRNVFSCVSLISHAFYPQRNKKKHSHIQSACRYLKKTTPKRITKQQRIAGTVKMPLNTNTPRRIPVMLFASWTPAKQPSALFTRCLFTAKHSAKILFRVAHKSAQKPNLRCFYRCGMCVGDFWNGN